MTYTGTDHLYREYAELTPEKRPVYLVGIEAVLKANNSDPDRNEISPYLRQGLTEFLKHPEAQPVGIQ